MMSTSLVEKMLAQKKATALSMGKQIKVIDEISNQSNNLLLEIEAERANEVKNLKISPSKKAYKYDKSIDQILPKAIELYERLDDDNDILEDSYCAAKAGFADFLEHYQLNNQYLSNNVRKTVVIADILQKATEDESNNAELEVSL